MIPADPSSSAVNGSPRIDLLRDADVAFWCRVFDVEHCELRRAIQQVGPRADAVIRYLRLAQQAPDTPAPGVPPAH